MTKKVNYVLLFLAAMLFLPYANAVSDDTPNFAASLDFYRLVPGDVLEIYIETIFEIRKSPDADNDLDLPPRMGLIYTIRDDETIALPKMFHSLNIEGLTVAETQSLIRRAYIDVLRILAPEAVITVSLISSESPILRDPLLDRLEEPAACDYVPASYEDGAKVSLQFVLDGIHAKTGIPFVINDEAVKASGDSQEIIVHAALPFHPPLKNVLNYLVRQHDLAWYCKDGTIHITDKDSDPARKLIWHAYYVHDLARPAGVNEPFCYIADPEDLQGIVGYIQTMVAPDSWNDETSVIRMLPYDRSATILVRQTEIVHAQIAKLLVELWRIRYSQGAYDVTDLVASGRDINKIVNLIKETVTPNAWEPANMGGWGKQKTVTICVYGNRLIISHNPDGHKKIAELLKQLRTIDKESP